MIPSWISDVLAASPWLGALVLVIFAIVKLGPGVRKLARLLDRIGGVQEDPATGQRRLPGLFERMDHQDEQLAEQSAVLETIRHEVEFNNGSSVKDAITRTETQVGDIGTKLDSHLAACPPQIIVNASGSQQ